MIKYLLLTLFCSSLYSEMKSQNHFADSTTVSKVFTELVNICKNVDFSDRKVTELGPFYKAALYIIYRGEDKTRAWKDFADYRKPQDKTGVDEICEKINRTVNQDSTYKILQYFTKTESEGTWHVLMVSYMKKGVEKKTAFAFLKVKDKFGLGDID